MHDGDRVLGYVEVQMLTRNLSDVYRNSWSGKLYYAIVSGDGRLFLSNFEPERQEAYRSAILQNAAWYPRTASRQRTSCSACPAPTTPTGRPR